MEAVVRSQDDCIRVKFLLLHKVWPNGNGGTWRSMPFTFQLSVFYWNLQRLSTHILHHSGPTRSRWRSSHFEGWNWQLSSIQLLHGFHESQRLRCDLEAFNEALLQGAQIEIANPTHDKKNGTGTAGRPIGWAQNFAEIVQKESHRIHTTELVCVSVTSNKASFTMWLIFLNFFGKFCACQNNGFCYIVFTKAYVEPWQ